MHLFKTSIIPATENIFWQLPDGLPDLNNKKILVFSIPFKPKSAEETTLSKMVAACSIKWDEVGLIQLNTDEKISWSLISHQAIPKVMLLLGITPKQLGIHAQFIFNACNQFLGYTFIQSTDLRTMEENSQIKRALWENGLKPCFSSK